MVGFPPNNLPPSTDSRDTPQGPLQSWQVQAALSDLARLSVNFESNIRSIIMDLAAMRAELKVVGEQVIRQGRTLTDGQNGQPSVIKSLTILEERLNHFIHDYENQEDRLSDEAEARLKEISAIKMEVSEIKQSLSNFQKSITTNENGTTKVEVKQGVDWGDNRTRIYLALIALIGSILTPVVVSYFTSRQTSEGVIQQEKEKPPAQIAPAPSASPMSSIAPLSSPSPLAPLRLPKAE